MNHHSFIWLLWLIRLVDCVRGWNFATSFLKFATFLAFLAFSLPWAELFSLLMVTITSSCFLFGLALCYADDRGRQGVPTALKHRNCTSCTYFDLNVREFVLSTWARLLGLTIADQWDFAEEDHVFSIHYYLSESSEMTCTCFLLQWHNHERTNILNDSWRKCRLYNLSGELILEAAFSCRYLSSTVKSFTVSFNNI